VLLVRVVIFLFFMSEVTSIVLRGHTVDAFIPLGVVMCFSDLVIHGGSWQSGGGLGMCLGCWILRVVLVSRQAPVVLEDEMSKARDDLKDLEDSSLG